MPAGADGDDVPGPALVGRDDVGAAAEQQQRTAGLVGVADRGDQLGGVLHLDQPVDRAADGEGGEVRQPGRRVEPARRHASRDYPPDR